MEDTLRDVLVVSANAAISAALVSDDLNVIPVDPAETPGWAEFASGAHLLVLDLGNADRAVDVVTALRHSAVDVPALVVADSVSDSPRLVSLRLADRNVKTLSWPLTPERLLRAVERAMIAGEATAERAEAAAIAQLDAELAAHPAPGTDQWYPLLNPAPAAEPAPAPIRWEAEPASFNLGQSGAPALPESSDANNAIQWPTFDPDSFEDSLTTDWRTAFAPGPIDTGTTPAAFHVEAPPATRPVADPPPPPPAPAPAPLDTYETLHTAHSWAQPATPPPPPPLDTYELPQASYTWTPPTAPPPPAPAPLDTYELPQTAYTWTPPTAPPPPAPAPLDTYELPQTAHTWAEPAVPPVLPDDLDLPPAPDTDARKHRLAPWARPRPGGNVGNFAPPAGPATAPAPVVPSRSQPMFQPPRLDPAVVAPAWDHTGFATPGGVLPTPAAPVPAPAPEPGGRRQRAAAKAQAKAQAADEKARMKAWAAAEKEAARARAAAEKHGLRSDPVAPPPASTMASAPEQTRLSRGDRARADRDARAAERAAQETARAEAVRAEVEARALARAALEAEQAERARLGLEAKAAQRAAAELARADKIRAEVEAKAAAEAARGAETEGRLRARADAEAARAAERAAAIAAKAAQENAGASSRAVAAAEKAVEKARAEAARIAQAQARTEERALQAQTEAQAKAVAEVTRHAERVAAEAARAEERARIVAERAAHAQAKIDSRLAAEAAKQARLLAEMEAHQAAVRVREDAEKARVAAKIAAEISRVETIARVQDMVQLTKIKAEAESIVGEAVRKTEEDFEARALANRPVYYGPELEPPGLGHLHHLMAMTDTLTAPAQMAEELAFLAMEHLGCEAVAMMIPDGDCWTTASGIGIGRNDLRYRLSEEHWFVRQVLGREALALIDDTAALRNELSGVPLAGWRYLLGIPLLDANSILVAANSATPFDAEAVEAFTEGIEDYTTELAEALAVRDVARQIHDRGNPGHRR